MVEKEKFSKEFEKNIKILVKDEYVSFLSKLFKLAYETPYLNKIDYENVQLVDFSHHFFHVCFWLFIRLLSKYMGNSKKILSTSSMNFTIFQIFNGVKTPPLSYKSLKSKKSGEKENSKASFDGENGKSGSISSSTSRKREGNTEELGKVLKGELQNIAGGGLSTLFTLCKVKQPQTIYILSSSSAFFSRISFSELISLRLFAVISEKLFP